MNISETTSQILEDLGERIRAARMDCGLSQLELGERVGVTRYTIGALESGQPKVAIGTVIEAARAVGLDIAGIEHHTSPISKGMTGNGKVTLDDDCF